MTGRNMMYDFSGKTLVVATHNEGKVREISELLAPYVGKVVSAGALGLSNRLKMARALPKMP